MADRPRMQAFASMEEMAELRKQLAAERARADGLQAVVDAAKAQKPVAWRPRFDIEGDFSIGEPSIESIDYWHEQGVEIEYAYLRAAPVPAQPVAVPEGDIVENLVALVGRLSHQLRKSNPASGLPEKAMSYVEGIGFKFKPARAESEGDA